MKTKMVKYTEEESEQRRNFFFVQLFIMFFGVFLMVKFHAKEESEELYILGFVVSSLSVLFNTIKFVPDFIENKIKQFKENFKITKIANHNFEDLLELWSKENSVEINVSKIGNLEYNLIISSSNKNNILNYLNKIKNERVNDKQIIIDEYYNDDSENGICIKSVFLNLEPVTDSYLKPNNNTELETFRNFSLALSDRNNNNKHSLLYGSPGSSVDFQNFLVENLDNKI